MDKSTQAKREKQAQERLQMAVLGIARLSGMGANDFQPLKAQVRPVLRGLYQLETLANILEHAAKLMKSASAKLKAEAEASIPKPAKKVAAKPKAA